MPFWVVRVYEFCQQCRIRIVAEAGGALCARCRAEAEIELEKILKDANDA